MKIADAAGSRLRHFCVCAHIPRPKRQILKENAKGAGAYGLSLDRRHNASVERAAAGGCTHRGVRDRRRHGGRAVRGTADCAGHRQCTARSPAGRRGHHEGHDRRADGAARHALPRHRQTIRHGARAAISARKSGRAGTVSCAGAAHRLRTRDAPFDHLPVC